jgi:hypothetical protein
LFLGLVMRSWKIGPKETALCQYIDCYWLLEKSTGDAGADFPKLNPDPAGHIIITHAQQSFGYTYENHNASGCGSHLILPHDKTLTMDHSQPFLVLGIKFHVGALYALNLPEQASRLNDIVAIDVLLDLQISPSAKGLLMMLPVDDAQAYQDRLDMNGTALSSSLHEEWGFNAINT